jgi:hypothetical protein
MKNTVLSRSTTPAFSGTWLLQRSTPVQKARPHPTFHNFLVFFRWRERHFMTTFSLGEYSIPGYTLGSYTIEKDQVRLMYGETGNADRVAAWWRKEADGSLTIYDKSSSENFLPGTFADAIAAGFDRKDIEEFLATAKREGWDIDPVARFPDGSEAPRPGKGARTR